jgi:hypothetical protein
MKGPSDRRILLHTKGRPSPTISAFAEKMRGLGYEVVESDPDPEPIVLTREDFELVSCEEEGVEAPRPHKPASGSPPPRVRS